ncbi:MAG: efflux RND transporter periplasmic adaptor subunit [Bacteroidota bacterium]
MSTKILKYIFSFSICLILLASCGKEVAEENPAEEHHEEEESTVELTEAQIKNAGIALGAIEQRQISGTIKVNGVLDVPPQQLVSVSAPIGGFLKNTVLLEGSRVKKGQAIATIENLDFIQLQQDYLEAKSNFEFAKADYERQQELAKENVNSAKTLQQSKANYASWQAKYNGLKEKLNVLNINIASVEEGNLKSFINLYSPIDGYVTEVNVNIGKFVNPSDVLFEIVDTEHLHAELIVFEKDVPKLKIGQKVRFTLANETKERMATVYLIGREISQDRTIQIHCHIDQEDKELLPGMYLMAVVEAGGTLVPALPNEAIIDYQGKKYIFIVTDGSREHEDENEKNSKEESGEAAHEEGHHFEMTEVQIGNNELGYTEVTLPEGFDEKNAQVVVKGAYSLLSKLKNSEEEGGHAH